MLIMLWIWCYKVDTMSKINRCKKCKGIIKNPFEIYCEKCEVEQDESNQ